VSKHEEFMRRAIALSSTAATGSWRKSAAEAAAAVVIALRATAVRGGGVAFGRRAKAGCAGPTAAADTKLAGASADSKMLDSGDRTASCGHVSTLAWAGLKVPAARFRVNSDS